MTYNERLQNVDAELKNLIDKANELPDDDGSGAESGGIDQIVVTGNCQYRFAYNGWNDVVDICVTSDISSVMYMFYGASQLESIPFEINCNSTTYTSMHNMFFGCNGLKTIPKINNCIPTAFSGMFADCNRLRYLPDGIENWFDYSRLKNYSGGHHQMFNYCYSLRSIPMGLFTNLYGNTNHSQSLYNYGFAYCYALDELIDIPIPYTATWTSNAFNYFGRNCGRLKNLTFALNEGAPYVMNWKSQTIDLSTVGYNASTSDIINYNSGITSDKLVYYDATYQALKDDADWYTTNIQYSRYNHDSAVATINSLPDTSAYLASAGGTNTIKFRGASGSATDGGAINTLTAEEIAVATAKGWTVTLV